MKKGWLIGLVGALAILTAALFFVYPNLLIPQNSSTVPANTQQTASTLEADTMGDANSVDTSLWKKYTNMAHGVEFLYPNNWTMQLEQHSITLTSGDEVTVTISANQQKISRDAYVAESRAQKKENDLRYPVDFSGWSVPLKVALGQNNAVIEDAHTSDTNYKLITFPEKGVSIKSELSSEESLDTQYFQKTVLALAQSLKFIEPLDSNEWLTFTNRQYGFTIKYPSDFKEYPTDDVTQRSFNGPRGGISYRVYVQPPSQLSNPSVPKPDELIVLSLKNWQGYHWEKTEATCHDVITNMQIQAKNTLSISFRTCKGHPEPLITSDEIFMQSVLSMITTFVPDLSQTRISLVPNGDTYQLLLNNVLYEKGDFYFDFGKQLTDTEVSSLNKIFVGSFSRPQLGFAEFKPRVESIFISPDKKIIIFTLSDAIDPGYSSTQLYDIENKKWRFLFDASNGGEYRWPIVRSISADNGSIELDGASCTECGASLPPNTFLYNIEQDKLKFLGLLVAFEWLANGHYEYKPCYSDGAADIPMCTNTASTTPAIVGSW